MKKIANKLGIYLGIGMIAAFMTACGGDDPAPKKKKDDKKTKKAGACSVPMALPQHKSNAITLRLRRQIEDRFASELARPTTARITPKPVPAMPKPTSTS